MSAYGKKSEPPHKAVKEMISKHSENSSKDPFHKGTSPQKIKVKRAA
jgi:hypothetical protein